MKKILLRIVSVILFLVAALTPVLVKLVSRNVPEAYSFESGVSTIILGIASFATSIVAWAESCFSCK